MLEPDVSEIGAVVGSYSGTLCRANAGAVIGPHAVANIVADGQPDDSHAIPGADVRAVGVANACAVADADVASSCAYCFAECVTDQSTDGRADSNAVCRSSRVVLQIEFLLQQQDGR